MGRKCNIQDKYNIIKGFYDGLKPSEIKKLTGKGPDAQKNVLASVGLSYPENWHHPVRRAWAEAEIEYKNDCIRTGRRNNPDWHELSYEDQKKYFDRCIDIYKRDAALELDTIMNFGKPVPGPIEQFNNAVSSVNKADSIKDLGFLKVDDILDYCEKHESDDYTLFKFTIPSIILDIMGEVEDDNG